MKVAMLAAGVGTRLEQGEDAPPKALLRFDGRSLLERHLALLAGFGLGDVTLAVGHRADLIRQELRRLGAGPGIRTRYNPDFRASSLLSLWTVREVFRSGEPVLYMDADVLYDGRLLERLLAAPHEDCLLIDRNVEPGEDPIKVCVAADRIVDFHKVISAGRYDFWAEWVGFARFGAGSALALARALDDYVARGRTGVIYEEPIRDVILGRGSFGTVDITGLPWVEIDFPDDLVHAREQVWPELQDGRDDDSR